MSANVNLSAKYSVYFTFETPAMQKAEVGVNDHCKGFQTKREAWDYVKAVRAKAEATGTDIDLVVYVEGHDDPAYRLVWNKFFMEETRRTFLR